ncbi:hypothetical protein N0V82_002363 [Gnomoniopsis sp. IMI 355080]|nr:hypothetical protein N0V82_002363 [Gnomoniopsis sp. IMI 355080]
MFPSPGNTVPSNQRLFKTVGARTLLYAPEAELDALLEATRDEIDSVVTPSYAELMHKDPAPKMGGISPVFFSVLYGSTHVMPATGTQMTPENISAMLKYSKSSTAWLAPSLLEDMLDFPSALETLATMKHVVFGGGPRSTEGGPCHLLLPPDSSHWNEFNFIDVGHKMEEVEDGLFELVYPNTELTRRCQLHFHSYPELSEYRTKDLFVPASGPGKEGWWTYRGRTDNWVIMSNALKMDPTDIENTVGSHPDVRGVLVAGDRRYRLCLLVELKDDVDRETVMTRLWPSIEEANKSSTKFGRIPRELVYFVPPEKPFLRASKGTIQRRLTIEAYADEINELYAKAEHGLLTRELPPLESLDERSLAKLLQYLYSDVLDLDLKGGIGMNDDVLAAGIDSFGNMTILSRLKAALRQYGVSEAKVESISIKNLYSASTVKSLSEQLITALSTSEHVVESGLDILAFVEKYRAEVQHLLKLKKAPAARQDTTDVQPDDQRHGETVLLTGSTGSLGSYLLDALLARPTAVVKRVICLNRGGNSRERQAKAFESRRLAPLPQDQKGRVMFLQADLSKDRLGLSQQDYDFLVRETTVIIHNAYPVNFLMTIRQFEPHLRGLLNLMELAIRGAGNVSMIFVSSISTGMSATGRRQRIPEVVLDTATQADDLLPQGYAQSKYVCEQMLQTFADGLTPGPQGQPVVVLRVGQICGPRFGSGPWNKWEWFPSLVMSSRFLGFAPDDIGQKINWIPVDELASIVLELMVNARSTAIICPENGEGARKRRKISSPRPLQVFNVVNPSISSWEEVLPALRTAVAETIPASEWVARLEESLERTTKDSSIDQNPGAKLVAFYKGAIVVDGRAEPVYDVDNLVLASSTAASLAPVTQSDLKRWMDIWNIGQ